MIQSTATFQQPNNMKSLPAHKIKVILRASAAEIANLPEGERRAYQRIRELAVMCGGWSAPAHQHYSEPTLRAHCIL